MVIRRSDLVGQKFGRLTCLEFVETNIRKRAIFKFQCDCGNIIKTLGCSVKNGSTKSCGCYQKERVSDSSRINITGQKFGRLTCLEFIKMDKNHNSVFKFQCDCGNITEATGNSVKRGNTKSCGCLHIEQASLLGSTVGVNNGKSNNKGWCYGSTRMRSGYEIFYASILDENKIDWEYEPETFKIGNGIRYTPDFYLPKIDTWVEIKGKMTDKNRQKISLFRRLTGNKLKVLFIKDLEKLAGQSYQSFMKENKEYYL